MLKGLFNMMEVVDIMFCHTCGKEIREGQSFCTACGTKVWKAEPVEEVVEETEAEPMEEVVEETEAEPMEEVVEEVVEPVEEVIEEVTAEPVKKGKGIKALVGIIIFIAALLGLGYFVVRPAIIEKTINEQTTKIMEEVKNGPSEKTLNQIVVGAVDDLTTNTYVRNYIKKNLTGENLKDIYSALVANMSYTTKLVKVDNDNYRMDINVKTVNNVTAAKNAISLYTKDHNIVNAVTDWLKADKSQLIKKYLTKASNELAQAKTYTNNTISIKIKINGLTDAEVDANVIDIGMRCLGLPGTTTKK